MIPFHTLMEVKMKKTRELLLGLVLTLALFLGGCSLFYEKTTYSDGQTKVEQGLLGLPGFIQTKESPGGLLPIITRTTYDDDPPE